MRKSLSMLMVLLLVLGLGLSTPVTLAAEGEVVDLTLFYQTSRSTNEFTDLVNQWSIDNLGINLIVTPGSSEWKQQLALYMTSGDLPDVVAFMDEVTFRTYGEQGAWYDITDMLDNYPNIRPYVAAQTDDEKTVWDRMSIEGRIYSVPYMTGSTVKYLNVVRKDWLDNLGLEMPTTLDELTEIMRAFKNDDPDGNGVDDTYGFGTYSADSLATLTEFFGAFGATPNEYTLLVDGKLVTNVISENFKEALAYLRDIYAEGLIYPEIFTQTSTQHYEEWVRGTYGVTTWWWTHAANSINRYGFLDANPDADMAFFDPVTGPDGFSGHCAEDDITDWISISSTSKHAEAAMKLFDCQSTFEGYLNFYSGPQGQFWTGEPETKTITWNWYIDGKDALGNEINDMQYYKILGNNPLQNQIMQLLPEGKRNDITKEQTVRINTATYYKNAFVGLSTEEFIDLSSETEKYYTNAAIKFITGEMDLEADWDTYVAGYLSNGGETIRQSLLPLYNERNNSNCEFAN